MTAATARNDEAPSVSAPGAGEATASASYDSYEDTMIAIPVQDLLYLLPPGQPIYLLPAPRYACYTCHDEGVVWMRGEFGQEIARPCPDGCDEGRRWANFEACDIWHETILAPAEAQDHAPEAAPPDGDWPETLAPADEGDLALWESLTAEAQATLKVIADAGGRAPVNGATDETMRTLSRHLLVLWLPDIREAVITAPGERLLAAASLEVLS